jgi:hypothetical protein
LHDSASRTWKRFSFGKKGRFIATHKWIFPGRPNIALVKEVSVLSESSYDNTEKSPALPTTTVLFLFAVMENSLKEYGNLKSK